MFSSYRGSQGQHSPTTTRDNYHNSSTKYDDHPKPAHSMDYVRTVVIAANVESLIEEPARIPTLVTEIAKEITEQKPIFAAIHFQGLKTRNRGHDTLERLVKELDNQPDIEQFNHSREYHDLENLGLCSLYFVKHEARPAMYDFQKREYWSVEGHRSEDAGKTTTVHKDRLNQGFGVHSENPAGYMMTKWKLFDKPFTFVNLNLSGEQSPLEGLKNYPSESAASRQKELHKIIDEVNKHVSDDALFLAGNYNFHINKEKFLQDQCQHTHAANHEHKDGKGALNKLEAIDMSGRRVFTVNSDKFDFHDLHDWVFGTCNGRLIRKYDRELIDGFKNKLYEAPIYFSPTGPYGYDQKKSGDFFLRSAAPAWKERILFNEQTHAMMHYDSFASSSIYYGLVGGSAHVGENKPVALISIVCLKPVKHGNGNEHKPYR